MQQKNNRQFFTISLTLAAVITFAACGNSSSASNQQESRMDLTPEVQQLAEQANEEGEVRLFVSTDAVTPSVEREIADTFNADMGIDIDVELVNGEPDPVYVSKLLDILDSGQESPVDLIATTPGTLQNLSENGAIAEVDWLALGAEEDMVSEEMHALTVAEIARAVFYNTDAVSEEDAPTEFEDLLDPKWQGKIVTSALPDVFSPLAIDMGEEGMVDFTDALINDQNASLATNPTGIRAQVISGEFDIGYGIRIGKNERDNNAAVAYAPIPSPVIPRSAVVLESAKNSSAAELLGYWLSTESGSKAAFENLDWPMHTTEGTDLAELDEASGGVMSEPLDWWLENLEKLNEAVSPIVGP